MVCSFSDRKRGRSERQHTAYFVLARLFLFGACEVIFATCIAIQPRSVHTCNLRKVKQLDSRSYFK